MNKAYIEEQNLIARYARGTLDAEEAAQFEVFLLDHPEMLPDVEYARAMQAGMEANIPALRGDLLDKKRPDDRRRIRFAPPLAVAASVLALVLGGIAIAQFTQISTLRDLVAQNRLPIAGEIFLQATRSGSASLIEAEPERLLILRFEANDLPNDHMVVRLTRDSSGKVLKEANIIVGNDGTFRFLLPALPSGRYQLQYFDPDGTPIQKGRAFELEIIK